MESEAKMENVVKYYNDELRCYRDGTIERKRPEWKEWRKNEATLIKINNSTILRARIIASCFLDVPAEGGYQVRHINGNNDDCNVPNLKIVINKPPKKPIVKNKKIWEGIKPYKTYGEDGENTKKFKVMFKGELIGDYHLLTTAKFAYDEKLGKKWIWRIFHTKGSIENKSHYWDRGRTETQQDAEIVGNYELLKVRESFGSEYLKRVLMLDIYEDN